MSDWDQLVDDGPADELELGDLDLLHDLTHPLRGAIFRRLKSPHSAAELAAAMDVPVTRLYHHLNRLEQVGLIRVVATRRVGAATERRYQVAARSMRLSDERFESYDPAEFSQAMGGLYDFAKLRLQREIETGAFRGRLSDSDSLLSLQELRISPDQTARLLARLRDVIDEFTALDRDHLGPPEPGAEPGADGGDRFVVFIAAHPAHG
jgi:DNA-binding transcriptional ArsR family regulator